MEGILAKLWAMHVQPQMATQPEFDEVFRAVKRTLRQANLANAARRFRP